MIYGFARHSGGGAHIRSVARRGTEVMIMLPATCEPKHVDNVAPIVDPQGAGEHLLIVEDMSSVRMFVAEVLQDAGYRCTLASDIKTALDQLENDSTIDLLLTDVGLPNMSGRDLADVARGWLPRLPILFMTGYAETATNRQAFLGAGMGDDY